MIVDVWLAHLDELPDLSSVLSPDEQSRASRFYRPQDRDRFIRARGALRHILARYLQSDPADLLFQYNTYGKPSLAGEDVLRFNLSHSHGMALCAVTSGCGVGVDVEHIREVPELIKIAERHFSPQDAAALRALAPEPQTREFFRCWTRKEAYLKGKGQGLSTPIKEQNDASAWQLRDLDPGPGYVGAVAVHAPECRLVTRNFSLLP